MIKILAPFLFGLSLCLPAVADGTNSPAAAAGSSTNAVTTVKPTAKDCAGKDGARVLFEASQKMALALGNPDKEKELADEPANEEAEKCAVAFIEKVQDGLNVEEVQKTPAKDLIESSKGLRKRLDELKEPSLDLFIEACTLRLKLDVKLGRFVNDDTFPLEDEVRALNSALISSLKRKAEKPPQPEAEKSKK